MKKVALCLIVTLTIYNTMICWTPGGVPNYIKSIKPDIDRVSQQLSAASSSVAEVKRGPDRILKAKEDARRSLKRASTALRFVKDATASFDNTKKDALARDLGSDFDTWVTQQEQKLAELDTEVASF